MTEHFTREEAETWEALQIADKGRKPVAVYMQAEIDALRATTAKLKGWDAQGDKAYKRGFSDGMKEAPTGESWIRAIDEAMVGAHIGVAEMADDYGTAKKKLNALICWSVQVDRDLSHALPAQPAEPVNAELTAFKLQLASELKKDCTKSNAGAKRIKYTPEHGLAILAVRHPNLAKVMK